MCGHHCGRRPYGLNHSRWPGDHSPAHGRSGRGIARRQRVWPTAYSAARADPPAESAAAASRSRPVRRPISAEIMPSAPSTRPGAIPSARDTGLLGNHVDHHVACCTPAPRHGSRRSRSHTPADPRHQPTRPERLPGAARECAGRLRIRCPPSHSGDGRERSRRAFSTLPVTIRHARFFGVLTSMKRSLMTSLARRTASRSHGPPPGRPRRTGDHASTTETAKAAPPEEHPLASRIGIGDQVCPEDDGLKRAIVDVAG